MFPTEQNPKSYQKICMITHENVSFVKNTGIKLELPTVSFCKVESSDHLTEKIDSAASSTKIAISSNLEKILWQLNTINTKEFPDATGTEHLTDDIAVLKEKTERSLSVLKDLQHATEQKEHQLNDLHDWVIDHNVKKYPSLQEISAMGGEEVKAISTELQTVYDQLKEQNVWLETIESNEPHIMESVRTLKTQIHTQIVEFEQLISHTEILEKQPTSPVNYTDMSAQTSIEYIPVVANVVSTSTRTPDNICISQSITADGKETISISNIPNLHSYDKLNQSNKVIIQASYKPGDTTGRHSEICLSNIPHTFETTVIEPNYTKTDIRVDEMGYKTVTVQKLSQSVQYKLQSNEATIKDVVDESPNYIGQVIEETVAVNENDAQPQVLLESKIAPVVDNVAVVDNITPNIMSNLKDDLIDTTNVQIAVCIEKDMEVADKVNQLDDNVETVVNVDDLMIWPHTAMYNKTNEVNLVKPTVNLEQVEQVNINDDQEQIKIWPMNKKIGFDTLSENYYYDFDITAGEQHEEEEEKITPEIKDDNIIQESNKDSLLQISVSNNEETAKIIVETTNNIDKLECASPTETIIENVVEVTSNIEENIKPESTSAVKIDLEVENVVEKKKDANIEVDNKENLIIDAIVDNMNAEYSVPDSRGYLSITLKVDPDETRQVQLNLYEVKDDPKTAEAPEENSEAKREVVKINYNIIEEQQVADQQDDIQKDEFKEEIAAEIKETDKEMPISQAEESSPEDATEIDENVKASYTEILTEPAIEEVLQQDDEKIDEKESENIPENLTELSIEVNDETEIVQQETILKNLIEPAIEEIVEAEIVQQNDEKIDEKESEIIPENLMEPAIEEIFEAEVVQQDDTKIDGKEFIEKIIDKEAETTDIETLQSIADVKTDSHESIEVDSKKRQKKKTKKKHKRLSQSNTSASSQSTPIEINEEKTIKKSEKELDIKEEQIYTLSSDDTYQSLSELVDDKIKVVEFAGTEDMVDTEKQMHSQIIIPISVVEEVETVDELQQTDELEKTVDLHSHSEAPPATVSIVSTESKDIQTITIDSIEIGSQTTVQPLDDKDVQTTIIESSEMQMQTDEIEQTVPTEHERQERLEDKKPLTDNDTQTEPIVTKDVEIQIEFEEQNVVHESQLTDNLYCSQDIVNPLISEVICKVIDASIDQHQLPSAAPTDQVENVQFGTNTEPLNNKDFAGQTIESIDIAETLQKSEVLVLSGAMEPVQTYQVCDIDVKTQLQIIPPKPHDMDIITKTIETTQTLVLKRPLSLMGDDNHDLSINLSVLEDDTDASCEPLSMVSECSEASSKSLSKIDKTLNLAAANHTYRNLNKSESVTQPQLDMLIMFIVTYKKTDNDENAIQEMDTGLKEVFCDIMTKALEIECKIEFAANSRSGLNFDADIAKLHAIRAELVEIKINKMKRIEGELLPNLPTSSALDVEELQKGFDSVNNKYLQLEKIINAYEIDLKSRKMRWNTINSNIIEIKSITETASIDTNKSIASDLPMEDKLDQLDVLELQMNAQITKLILILKSIKQFSVEIGYHVEVPENFYLVYEKSKILQNNINLEKNRIISFLGLAEEYEQTLEEFSKILKVAANLVESRLAVVSLEQLQEEVQKHRKFFININHCRSILESLESNLDARTKAKNKITHNLCYAQATDILEQASDRFQKLASATSKLTNLEREMRNENQWLQVAHQRLPDLSTVSSADYEQFITFYKSFSLDIGQHYSKMLKISDDAARIQDSISAEYIVQASQKALLDILQLREEATLYLNKLLAFSEIWNLYNSLNDKLEGWMLRTERQLSTINVPSDLANEPVEKMREFWEIKAQFEVYNTLYNDSGNYFEDALKFVNVSDDSLQRQYNNQFSERWERLTDQITDIQTKITNGVSDVLIPANEKILLLKEELAELKLSMAAANKDVLKNQDELRFHIERLEVFKYRVTFVGSELGKIGLLSSIDSNEITDLFAITRSLSLEVEEDLEMSNLMQERLNIINSGINQVRRRQSRMGEHLNECADTEKQESSSIERALGDLYAIQSDLTAQWTEIMHLRQLLHTLPSAHKVFVSPVQLERELTAIQDVHASLEKRYELVYSVLRERLSHWKRFEQQLEIIHQYINETEYMMDILQVHDHIDLKRLSQATERLQDLQTDLIERQVAIDDLKVLAQPLVDDSLVEISKNLQNTIEQTVTSWANTKDSLKNLCTKYQKAISLWNEYHDCSAMVDCWLEEVNEKLDNVVSNDDGQQKVGVSVTTNFDGCKDKLQELDGLVNEIAQLLKMDAPPNKLQSRIEILKSKFENTQEFIVSLEKLDPHILRASKLDETNVLKSLKTEIDNISSTFVQNVDGKKIDDLQTTLISLSTSMGKVEDVQKAAPSYFSFKTNVKEDEQQEIFDLWQNLFIEIYHKYQNSFTELLPNDASRKDCTGLVNFWNNYLLYVNTVLLTESLPTSYTALVEQKHLLDIHQNLLTNQTRIFEKYLADFAKDNKDLLIQQEQAMSVLHEINNRIAKANARLDKWNTYQQNRQILLEWFKDFEIAKSDLQLRNLNLKRIPKVIEKVEQLLEEITSAGENQLLTLTENQNELMLVHGDSLSSLQIENIACRQRISNLTASLNTWKDFLKNISITGENYEALLKRIQQTHDQHSDFLRNSEANIEANYENSENVSKNLQQELDELNADQDIIRLEEHFRQLQQCINLAQARSLTQVIWMLQQKRNDLIHEYTSLQYRIKENQNLRSSFVMVCHQFIDWLTKSREKLLVGNSGQPTELYLCHKTNHLEAINVRENEKNWIFQTGAQLMTIFQKNPRVCAEIQEKLDQVSENWGSLKDLYDAQYAVSSMSLISSDNADHKVSTIYSLEIRINEIREWLIEMQKQICIPFRFDKLSDAEFNKYVLEQENLQKSLEKQSGGMGEVLNLCEMICATDEQAKNQTNLKMLYMSMKNLDRRWKSVCVLLPNRKKNLFNIWKSLKKTVDYRKEHLGEDWLRQQQTALTKLRNSVEKISHKNVKTYEQQIKSYLEEIHRKDDIINQLKYCCQDLLTNQFIHIESDSNVSNILQNTTATIKTWRELLSEGESLERLLQKYTQNYNEFIAVYTDTILLLTNLDVELTNLKYSLPIESSREKDVDDQEQLKQIHDKFLNYQKNVVIAEQLYSEHLQATASDYDLLKLEEMIEDMRRLCASIKDHLGSTMKAATMSDESVQVNTLFFDFATQVNTLNYLDSDTYKHELFVAYKELCVNINQLVQIVDCGEQTMKVSRIIANCESSLELCKHLCQVLIRDYTEFVETERKFMQKLQDEEIRFYRCMDRWKIKQQSENSSISSEDDTTCGYCNKLDWQAIDNDLWRLEQWLQYAEKTQQTYDFKALTTYSIEQLEDIIQDHREFLLDLDSHKMIVASLSLIGDHLSLHRQKSVVKIPRFHEKLDKNTTKWDAVCKKETEWQIRLHKALLSNDEFYNIIDDLTEWLVESEIKIKQLYPFELNQEFNFQHQPEVDEETRQLYEENLKNLQDNKQELDQCEPRILSLQEAAQQLFISNDVNNKDSKLIYERLTKLKIGLHALQKICNLYIIRLATYLGYNLGQLNLTNSMNAETLHTLSSTLLETTTTQQRQSLQAASSIPPNSSFKTARSHETTPNDTEEIDGSGSVQRRSRINRIIRTSLPIQALMLLILGAVAILPQGQDYACTLANNFARSLEPMLRWNGPPPF